MKKGKPNVLYKVFKLEHWIIIALVLCAFDVIAVNASYFMALWLRFDCMLSQIPEEFLSAFFTFAPFYTVFCVFVFYRCKLYKSIWRFASYNELIYAIVATCITFFFHVAGITLFIQRMPISYYLFGILVQFVLTLGIRFSYRLVLLIRNANKKNDKKENVKKVLLVGAGEAGLMILRDTLRSKEANEVIACIIDDNPNKWGRYVEDVMVVGGRNEIPSAVEKYRIDKIYIAIPSASAKNKKEIIDICQETGCEVKTLGNLYELVDGNVNVRALKDVSVNDLLGREPVRADMKEVFEFISGKRILVTGGGGSIGSELCRQIAKHEPAELVIFDIYENNAYDIQMELKDKYPSLSLKTLIGSVRDSRKLDEVFQAHRPQIVYHAAAHKHVPLMEDSPCEAIKNNSIGTYKTAYAAMKYGCERFVLISTDKAVNPTNIMGASKRLCEMVVQAFDKKIKAGKANEIPFMQMHEDDMDMDCDFSTVKTEYVAVRFGNVLGSNGSVIPLFKKQIEKGGPVTVTHKDIIRYFMTIPEAVSLVLLAGTYAKGGEIFVLDMGSPVKIDTLARNLIRLSGLKPDVDIKIEYTGLRPGEKLYEEKLMAEEGLTKTPNDLIHIGKSIEFDENQFFVDLHELMEKAVENSDDIRDLVSKLVPTYHPAGKHGSEAKGEVYERLVKGMK